MGRIQRNTKNVPSSHVNSQPSTPFVPSGEVYPLVLSFGITIQGITFAVAQSTGLKGLGTFGCTTVSQLMLPG